MSIPSSCRYIYILIFSGLLLCCASRVDAQRADTVRTDSAHAHKTVKHDSAGHQLVISIDLVNPVRNALYSDRYGYEAEADYYTHNDFYLTLEGGWGGSNVNYSDLKYTTTNSFYRLGFNKAVLARDNKKDWDMLYFGLRGAFAPIRRGSSSFVVTDTLWGNTSGTRGSKEFTAIWAELNLGMRVELLKGWFAGWCARGNLLLNEKSFSLYAPLYIAGYGKGDKSTSFDVSLYISRAIRWKRKHIK